MIFCFINKIYILQNIAKHVIKYMFANTTKKYAFVNEVNFQNFCYCPDLIKIV